ncbi:MAG: NAD-dependent epimerase/dehydratase family protein [Sphingomonas sp.]
MTVPTLPAHVAQALARAGKRVILTGASGWLGLATLELLEGVFGAALASRVVCFGGSARTLGLRSGTRINQYPLDSIAALEPMPSMVLHFAALTRDRAEVMAEADYRASALGIRTTVLAALGRCGADAVFLASSGAAARVEDAAAPAALRCYGDVKRDDEQALADWAEATGNSAVIARIFNVSGPYINKTGHYALSTFISAALAGQPIRINAGHRVERGYVAIRELMAVVLAELIDSTSMCRFDAGGDPVELGTLAQLVSDVLGPVPIVRAAAADAPVDRYVGNATVYQTLLAKHRIAPVPLATQIVETADWLAIGGTSADRCAA